MRTSYDVLVAGGSIAGLLCAREIASAGHAVLVVEEDYEIGTPEHCGGLVSSTGLEELGIIPSGGTLLHHIRCARIRSPDMEHAITLDASKQNVACTSRRDLDKQVAHQSQRAGADIVTRTSLQKFTENGAKISGDGGSSTDIRCKVLVDARGASSLAQRDRTGIIPSAQYEVYADWMEDGTVEVMPDSQRYPGFFAWVIPSGRGRGRVGVAGRGINAAAALESFLKRREEEEGQGKGGHAIIRKIFAPIWVKGPIKRFYNGRITTIGDAAGQAKPTTAGGIFSSGMGGILAGQAISDYLESPAAGMDEMGSAYQRRWRKRFGSEFDRQLLARRILERADNAAITNMISAVTPQMCSEVSASGDFDFHTSAIIKLLGVTGTVKAAKNMIASEIRRIV